ncbi:hypothetical protein EON79_02070 [bacterium]|nr:MAG: hypothetical protein EON79_02070 [bacterium]
MIQAKMPRSPKRILFDTYWGAGGWRATPITPSDDLAYAMGEGMMFAPRRLDHDAVMAWALEGVARTDARRIASAFVSSLETRQLEVRSALGTFAAGRHLRPHPTPEKGFCEVCNVSPGPETEDLNVLQFERFKWGGVRHSDPLNIGFDLERFAEAAFPPPTPEAFGMLASILDAARHLAPDARPSGLERAIAPLFRGNAAERRIVIEILGYAGVLQPRNLPSFRDSWVDASQRPDRPEHTNDWAYPASWWTGADGVNEEAVREWFGTSIMGPA